MNILQYICKKFKMMFKKKSKLAIQAVEYCSGVFINCKAGEFSSNISFDKIHLIDPYCKTPNK